MAPRHGQERSRVHARRIRAERVVGRFRVVERRVGEGGSAVVARSRAPRLEVAVLDPLPAPGAAGAPVHRVVQVVVDDVADVLAVGVLDERVARAGHDDVVRDQVVPGVELHEELDAVGVHDRVVHDHAVFGAAAAPVVPADRDPDRRGVVDDVVADRHVPRGTAGMLARELDTDVDVVHDVALDQHVATAVDVDAVGAPPLPVRGVAVAVDVPHGVASHDPVASLVDRRVRCRSLEPDHVDADVVRVVDAIALDQEVLDVAVHHQRLGRAQREVRQFVVDDLDLFDRVVALGAEDPDPVCVALRCGRRTWSPCRGRRCRRS